MYCKKQNTEIDRNEQCVVMLCNKNYFDKFVSTCDQLINRGNYKGDICLVIGDDLKDDALLNHDVITNNDVIIKYYSDIRFSLEFLYYAKSMNRADYWFHKLFQYHKFHLFDTYFKRWKYIFYIDCGITIFKDISPILNLKKPNKLLANSDAYPTYVWKLHNQFAKDNYFDKLSRQYNLNVDYPQSTIMLYDTNIIEEDTVKRMLELLEQYPNSITNDQGIIALYFTNIKPFFEQVSMGDDDTNYYDYLRRNNKEYIMLKMC